MTRLSVNVNKVALLRNSRPLDIPDVVRAAELAIDAGAHGITVHPRPDARHIRPADVYSLYKLVRARGVEFNIEGNPFQPIWIWCAPSGRTSARWFPTIRTRRLRTTAGTSGVTVPACNR